MNPLKALHFPRLRALAIAALAGVVVLMGLSVWTPFLRRGELYAQDVAMRETTTAIDPDLVLLALDEETLTLSAVNPEEISASRALQLMSAGYPFSREVYALIAEKLLAAGARTVIFDFLFPSPRVGDAELATVIRQSEGRVVIGSNFDVRDGAGQLSASYIPPTPELAAAAGDRVGYVTLAKSVDSVVREFYPYATVSVFRKGVFGDDPPLPAMTTVAAQVLGFAPTPTHDPSLLRFAYLRPDSIPQVSAYQIFVPAYWERNFKNGDFFNGKTVLMGPTASRLQDFHQTPFGRMEGPVVQLNILSAMKRNAWIDQVPYWITFLSIPLAGTGIFILSIRRKSVGLFLLGLGVFALCWSLLFLISYLWLSLYLPLVHPLAAILVCGLATLATDVSLERKERGRLRGTLERYVSKDIVREIVDNSDSYLQNLGGQRKTITVLFCDLKGFTSAVETMEASEVVRLLNEYFGEMVEAVFAHQGTMDKFIGDALMATWGGLRESGIHVDARQAVLAALDMKRRRLALNTRRSDGADLIWEAGIGLSQGLAVFGNIGSQEKMDPTVIGDAVNLASRIEGLTRVYGCDILIDERVASQAHEVCPMLLVDIVRVKGRRAHEPLFFPYESRDQLWVDSFNLARKAYLEERFAEAEDLFTGLIATGPAPGLAECYRQRCDAFQRKPPHEGWDGVWEFLEK